MKFSFKAMWNNKCPNCQQGDMYKKPFQMSKLLDMHERCENVILILNQNQVFILVR